MMDLSQLSSYDGVEGLKKFLNENKLSCLVSAVLSYGFEELDSIVECMNSKKDVYEAFGSYEGVKRAHTDMFYMKLKKHQGLPENSLAERTINQSMRYATTEQHSHRASTPIDSEMLGINQPETANSMNDVSFNLFAAVERHSEHLDLNRFVPSSDNEVIVSSGAIASSQINDSPEMPATSTAKQTQSQSNDQEKINETPQPNNNDNSNAVADKSNEETQVAHAGENITHDNIEYTIAGIALEKFKIPKLKQFQIDGVRQVIEGKNALIIQPTGSGKSLLFKLVPLITNKPIVVVTPTRALMIMHVQSLQSVGISCAIVGGGQSDLENAEIELKFKNGEFKLLFVCPEYLFCRSNKFMEQVLSMDSNRELSAVCVDECHCCYKWSVFRTAYLKLEQIKGLKNSPVILMSATVKTDKIDELVNRYLPANREIYRSIESINRPNIKIEVRHIDHSLIPRHQTVHKAGGSEEYYRPIIEKVADEIGSDKAVIYYDNTEVVRVFCALLAARGIKTNYVVGSQNLGEKIKVIQEWTNGETQVIVATTSFGMGLNLSDVRFVYRFGYCETIEELVQEFGRAGRDGSLARGIMIVCDSDQISSARMFLRPCKNDVEQANVSECLNEVCAFASTDQCLRQFILRSFNEPECGTCWERSEVLCKQCADAGETEKQDVTEELFALLRAVGELNGLGLMKTTLYVMGSKNVKIGNVHRGEMFGAGMHFQKSQEWWSLLVNRAIGLLLLKQTFYPDAHNLYTYSRISVTLKGKTWLNTKSQVLIYMGSDDTTDTKRKKSSGNRKYVRKMLLDNSEWLTLTEKHEQQFPGVHLNGSNETVLFIKDVDAENVLNSDKTVNGLASEIQFKKGKNHRYTATFDVDGEDEPIEMNVLECDCGGLKICSGFECTNVHSSRNTTNKCLLHINQPLTSSETEYGKCNVKYSILAPTNVADKRRWVVVVGGVPTVKNGVMSYHNHPVPLTRDSATNKSSTSDLHCPQTVSDNLRKAAELNSDITATGLLKGVGQKVAPFLLTNKLNQRHVKHIKNQVNLAEASSTGHMILQFNESREAEIMGVFAPPTVVHQKRIHLLDHALPYVRKHNVNIEQDSLSYLLVMSPAHSQMINGSKVLQLDVTVNENKELPYLINGVTFCYELNKYVSVFKFRCKDMTPQMYDLAFRLLSETLKNDIPDFDWKQMEAILVDWDATQMNALYRCLGAEEGERLIKGCKVHMARCLNRARDRCVADLFKPIFRQIAFGLENCYNEEHLRIGFNVLGGTVDISALFHIPAFRGVQELTAELNGHQRIELIKDNAIWVKWWTTEKRLKAIVNYTIGPTDTNALEGNNRILKQGVTGQAGGLKGRIITVWKQDYLDIADYSYALQNPTMSSATNSYQHRSSRAKKQRNSRKRRLQAAAANNGADVQENHTLASPSKRTKLK